MSFTKPRNPPVQSFRLLDQVRERVQNLHCGLRTKKNYIYWVRFFVRWHGRNGTMTHPRDMEAKQVKAFLTMLATESKASASTHDRL